MKVTSSSKIITATKAEGASKQRIGAGLVLGQIKLVDLEQERFRSE